MEPCTSAQRKVLDTMSLQLQNALVMTRSAKTAEAKQAWAQQVKQLDHLYKLEIEAIWGDR